MHLHAISLPPPEAVPKAGSCAAYLQRRVGEIMPVVIFTGMLLMASAEAQEVVTVSESSAIGELSPGVRETVERQCLPIQYSTGAAAYRQCLTDAIQRLTADGSSPLRQLGFDDQYAVQQSCLKQGPIGSSAFQGCVATEIQALSLIPQPDLASVADDEGYVLQRSCFDAQSNQGAASYRRCLNEEIARLRRTPTVDLSFLSSIERNAIQLRCSPANRPTSAADYRACAARELTELLRRQGLDLVQTNVVTGSNTTAPSSTPTIRNTTEPDTTAATSSPGLRRTTTPVTQNIAGTSATPIEPVRVAVTTPTSSTATDTPLRAAAPTPAATAATDLTASPSARAEHNPIEPRIITRPQVSDTPTSPPISGPSTLATTNVEVTDSGTTTSPAGNDRNPLLDSVQPVLDYLTAIPWRDYRQYLFYLLYVLPILLLALVWRLISALLRRRRTAERSSLDTTALHKRIRPDQIATPRLEYPFDDTQNQAFDELSGPALRSWPIHSVEAPSGQERTRTNDDFDSSFEIGDETQANIAYSETAASYRRWFESLPGTEERKRFAIEYLLYWVSYGDGNYDPSMRERLLEAEDLSDHDLVKQAVLRQDHDTLIETLSFVRRHFDAEEQRQILCLMLALLVTHPITPVQNLFMRFFADFVGVGIDGLASLYHESFNVKLPPIPRPDDMRWWSQQNSVPQLSADASERASLLHRFGLTDPVSDDTIAVAYAQARKRYRAENFTRLGDKERDLARRHLQRYTDAYHALCGVSA